MPLLPVWAHTVAVKKTGRSDRTNKCFIKIKNLRMNWISKVYWRHTVGMHRSVQPVPQSSISRNSVKALANHTLNEMQMPTMTFVNPWFSYWKWNLANAAREWQQESNLSNSAERDTGEKAECLGIFANRKLEIWAKVQLWRRWIYNCHRKAQPQLQTPIKRVV